MIREGLRILCSRAFWRDVEAFLVEALDDLADAMRRFGRR